MSDTFPQMPDSPGERILHRTEAYRAIHNESWFGRRPAPERAQGAADDPLAGVKGCLWGLLLSAPIWVTLVALAVIVRRLLRG